MAGGRLALPAAPLPGLRQVPVLHGPLALLEGGGLERWQGLSSTHICNRAVPRIRDQ